MRNFRNSVLSSTNLSGLSVIPTRKFRRLKDETGEHSGGGNESQSGAESGGGQQGGNNEGVNSGQNSGQSQDGNNSGNGFDAGSFWNQPSEETSGAPKSGSAGSGDSSGGQPQNEGNAFAERLNSLNFGDGIFTPDAMKKLTEESDTSALSTNLQGFGRETVRQSVLMTAQLMQRNNEQLMERFTSALEAKFGQRDAETDLGKSFPSYNKPGMKPMIDGIFTQAMKLSKGNRAGAIEMTREMLKHSTNEFSSDLGLNQAPGGAEDQLTSKTNWAEELLGRDS